MADLEFPPVISGAVYEYVPVNELVTRMLNSDFQFSPPRSVFLNRLRQLAPQSPDDLAELVNMGLVSKPTIITLLQVLEYSVDRKVIKDNFNYYLWIRLHSEDDIPTFIQRLYDEDIRELFRKGMYESIMYLIQHGAHINTQQLANLIGDYINPRGPQIRKIPPSLTDLIGVIVDTFGPGLLTTAVYMPYLQSDQFEGRLFAFIVLTAPGFAVNLLQRARFSVRDLSMDGGIGHFILFRLRDSPDSTPVLDLLRYIAKTQPDAFEDTDVNGETAIDFADWLVENRPVQAGVFQEARDIIMQTFG